MQKTETRVMRTEWPPLFLCDLQYRVNADWYKGWAPGTVLFWKFMWQRDETGWVDTEIDLRINTEGHRVFTESHQLGGLTVYRSADFSPLEGAKLKPRSER